jgi:PKD repeat protein
MRFQKNAARAAVAAVAALAAGAVAETTVVGNQGPSSSQTPYIVPVAAGVRTVSILTAGDTVNTKLDAATDYRMVGIPDGLGAIDGGDGTMIVTVNHEVNAGSGIARAHGSAGAFVSAWRIDRTSLRVKTGYDLIRTIETWNAATQAYVQGTTAFDRFCSADLPAVTAFYDPATGLGTTERFHVNGEETSGGRAFAHQVTGVNAGVSWELPKLGKQAWENQVACPHPQTRTIVIGTDDTTPGQVFVYVGTKQSTGNDIQRAGLTNGTLHAVQVPGVAAEARVGGIGLAKGVAGSFALVALPDQAAAGANTETAASAAGAATFLRPEDGAWDPSNPADFYFVTTDQFDQVKDGVGATIGRTRLWRLRFTDIASPASGGSITMLLDGTEPGQMFDNICLDRAGHVLLLEDVGGNAHNGKVWQFEIATGDLKLLAKHDPARFGDIGVAATAPFSNDEEASGIIDASDLLGAGWFLVDTQAHYAISGELFQGGQLMALFNPDSVVAPAIVAAASATPNPADVAQTVSFSVDASSPASGVLSWAWSFGDGGTANTQTATHAYAAEGTYHATVVVTHVASGKTSQSAVDVVVQRPFSCFEAEVHLDFKDGRNDTLIFTGELPLPAGFDPKGEVVSIDVGGLTRSFTLSANGDSNPAPDQFKLDIRKVGNSVPRQRAQFTATVRGGDVESALADEGMTNKNASGEPCPLTASLTFDGRTESAVLELIYDAQVGKKGDAR